MISRAGLIAMSALILVAALGMPMGAVQAGAAPAVTYRPDGLISTVCSGVPEWRNCDPAWVGDGIYNNTARKQNRAWTDYLTYSTEPDPRVVVFKISIQNDGLASDRFTVDADGITSGYKVKFLRGSTNITPAVQDGSYLTPTVPPGGSLVIKAKVIMPCDSWDYCGQDRATRLVAIRSVADPSLRDAVKLAREIWECTC